MHRPTVRIAKFIGTAIASFKPVTENCFVSTQARNSVYTSLRKTRFRFLKSVSQIFGLGPICPSNASIWRRVGAFGRTTALPCVERFCSRTIVQQMSSVNWCRTYRHQRAWAALSFFETEMCFIGGNRKSQDGLVSIDLSQTDSI